MSTSPIAYADLVVQFATATGTGSFALGERYSEDYGLFSEKIEVGSLVGYVARQGTKSERGYGLLESESQLTRIAAFDSSDTGIANNINHGSPSLVSFVGGQQITVYSAVPSRLFLALDADGNPVDPSPFRNALVVQSIAEMKAEEGLVDKETLIVAGNGIFYIDMGDASAPDNVDTFRPDNYPTALFKRMRLDIQGIFNGALIIDAAEAGDSYMDFFTAKKASNSTKFFRWLTDAASGAFTLAARLNQSSVVPFLTMFSLGTNADRFAFLKPFVMPTKANAQGLKDNTFYLDTTDDEIQAVVTDAADNTTAADRLTIPRVKGTYLLGTYETTADLIAIDAAKYAKANQRALILGKSDGGDCPPFFVEWLPSSSASATVYSGSGTGPNNCFRPSVGAAASGNGRWIRVAADGTQTAESGVATPSLAAGEWIILNDTDITDITNEYEGAIACIQRGSSDQSIIHDPTKINLAGSNITLTTANPVVTLKSSGGVWRLISGGGLALANTITINLQSGADLGAALTNLHSYVADGSVVIINSKGSLTLSTTPVISKTLCIMTQSDIVVSGAHYISLTGTKQRWNGGRFRGDQTTGQYAIKNSGSINVIENVSGELLDIVCVQPTGAGFMNVYDKIRCRNNKTAHIWLQDGVGPRVTNCFGDIDGAWYSGSYTSPTNGAVWLQTEGAFLRGNDFIHSGGLRIECPSTRHVEWLLSGQNYWDSTNGAPGIEIINNDATYKIRGLWFEQEWSCTGKKGVHIHGTGVIDGVHFNGQPIHNNSEEAYKIESGTNIFVSDTSCYGANAPVPTGFPSKTGDYPSVYVNTAGRVRFSGGAVLGQAVQWNTTPTYHFYLDASVADFQAHGVSMDASVISGKVFQHGSATNVYFIDCPGYNSGGVQSKTTVERIRAGGARLSSGLWVEDDVFGRLDISGTLPSVNLYDSDSGTGAKYTRVYNGGGDFLVQAMDDSYANAQDLIKGTRNGANWSSLDFYGASSTSRIALGGSSRGNLWVEDNIFGRVDLRGTGPSFNIYTSGAATNEKYARLTNSSFEALTDAYGSPSALWGGARSGATWTRMSINAPLNKRSYTVAQLLALTSTDGDCAFVSDTTLTVALSFGVAISGTGGGSNKAPVYYDGAWKIG